MISDLRKSINSILFERVTSPFYGTLVVSWVIWNWRIVYLTFFISELKLKGTKIDYIIENYNDVHHLISFPLLSTLVLITLIPFVTNGAYWLHLKFNQWKINQKNEIEKKQLLTLAQSIEIRRELKEKETEFDELLSKKENTIISLRAEITELENRIKEPELSENVKKAATKVELSRTKTDYDILKNNQKAFENFGSITKSINKTSDWPSGISSDIKEYFLINDIIIKKHSPHRGNYYNLTPKGNQIYKEYFNETFNSNNQ
ncbi:hypothetical protein [Ancylomarina sp.]|uniref:hypothetical protein n=1 Tax=Ancylomarina sp. TaxID=1970196 RepID=UPI003564CBA0